MYVYNYTYMGLPRLLLGTLCSAIGTGEEHDEAAARNHQAKEPSAATRV